MNLIPRLVIYLASLRVSLADVPGCYFENTSWSSPDILDIAFPVTDYLLCQNLCQDTTGCVAWTWTTETNLEIQLSCVLYSSLGKKTFLKETVSGPVECSCSGPYACTATEDNANEVNLVPGVEKEAECRELCDETPACQYYTWHDEKSSFSFLCFLLSSCDNTDNSCTGCFSGKRECSEEIDTTMTTGNTTSKTTTVTTITTTTTIPDNTRRGIIISGGTPAFSKWELFDPATGVAGCKLPDLPNGRKHHTMNGLVVCGGIKGNDARTSCLTFSSGRWTNTHKLLEMRFSHSSWLSDEGLVIMGGAYDPKTTELLKSNYTVPYFDLKYDTYQACAIPDTATNTVILVGGNNNPTKVSRYGSQGWVEDLPELNEGRYKAACSAYYRDDGTRVLLVTGGDHKSTEILVQHSNSWTVTTDFPIKEGSKAITANNIVYCTGGSSMQDGIYQWEDDKQEWVLTGRMISSRADHALSTVTLDDELINYCINKGEPSKP